MGVRPYVVSDSTSIATFWRNAMPSDLLQETLWHSATTKWRRQLLRWYVALHVPGQSLWLWLQLQRQLADAFR